MQKTHGTITFPINTGPIIPLLESVYAGDQRVMTAKYNGFSSDVLVMDSASGQPILSLEAFEVEEDEGPPEQCITIEDLSTPAQAVGWTVLQFLRERQGGEALESLQVEMSNPELANCIDLRSLVSIASEAVGAGEFAPGGELRIKTIDTYRSKESEVRAVIEVPIVPGGRLPGPLTILKEDLTELLLGPAEESVIMLPRMQQEAKISSAIGKIVGAVSVEALAEAWHAAMQIPDDIAAARAFAFSGAFAR